MVLNYNITDSARIEAVNIRKGYIRIKINDLKIAEFIRVDKSICHHQTMKFLFNFKKNSSNIDIG